VIDLVRAELWRFWSRRLFRVLLGLVAGPMLVLGLVLVARSVGVNYEDAVPSGMRIAAQPLFVLSVVAGASFVGAEWACGAMTTLLTWEPRRGRVLAAKVAAVSGVVAPACWGLLLFLALMLLPAALAHGTVSGLTASWWLSLAGLWLKVGALGVMGAWLGMGLAGALRNSAGPIAIWLIFEFVVAQILTFWRPGLFRWMPDANVQQFLASEEIFGVTVNGQELFGSFSTLRAGLVLALYAAVAIAVSYATFRSRDVT
jgi:ABC-2 type transport system permease protein